MRLYHKLLLLLLFFPLTNMSFAQNLDSLHADLSKIPEDSIVRQLQTIKEIVSVYAYSNLDSAVYYGEVYQKKAEEIKDKSETVRGYNMVSDALNRKGLYNEAEKRIRKGLSLSKEISDDEPMMRSLFLLGNILQNQNLYRAADSAYLRSLTIAESIKDSVMMGKNIQGRGMNMDYLGKYDEAVKLYFDAIKIAEKINDDYGLSRAYTNLGNAYGSMKQADNATEYYLKAAELKRKAANYSGLSVTYYNIASAYYNSNGEEARMYFDSSLVYARLSNNTKMLIYGYQAMGTLLNKEGKHEEAFEYLDKGAYYVNQTGDLFTKAMLDRKIGETHLQLGNTTKALKHLRTALDYVETIDYPDEERRTLLSYINALKAAGNYREVAENYRRVFDIKDTIFTRERTAVVNELETKYQTEKKETENLLLKKEKNIQALTIKNQKYLLGAGLTALFFAVLISYILYRQNKKRAQTNATLSAQKEKIETLHQELNHRVKNNLAFIAGLLQIQRSDTQDEATKNALTESERRIEVISLLHRKLSFDEQEEKVDPGKFLEELCINLINTFPHNGQIPELEIEHFPIKIDGEDTVSLGLIVNELITNSFKYAFDRQKKPRIVVRLYRTSENSFDLVYSDNGKGLPAHADIKDRKSSGLRLIKLLVNQLRGNMQAKSDLGVTYTFRFPL